MKDMLYKDVHNFYLIVLEINEKRKGKLLHLEFWTEEYLGCK